MRPVILVACLALASCTSDADAPCGAPAEPAGQVPAAEADAKPRQTDRDVDNFVFVGKLASIQKAPDPCEEENRRTGTRDCFAMDEFYRARYRIVQPIAGAHAGDEIEFMVADHYGFPAFARYPDALLFVGLFDDGPWLHKYQAIPLHRTVEGQWASCGGVEGSIGGKPPRSLQPLRFAGSIGLQRDLPKGLLESHAAGRVPWLSFSDGAAWCSHGVLLEDAYEVVRSGVMHARGVVLPPWQADEMGQAPE